MRTRRTGWTRLAVLGLCVLMVAGSCWMLGCGDDKPEGGNGNGNGGEVKDPPTPTPPEPAPKTQPAKTTGKKGKSPLSLWNKLTDGK